MAVSAFEKLFNEYYEKYHKSIEQYCKRRLNEYPEDAEEVINDVFKVIYLRMEKGEVFELPEAFMMKTAHILVDERFKKLKGQSCVVSLKAENPRFSYEQNFDDAITDEMLVDVFKTILKRLPKKEAEMLIDICEHYRDAESTSRELAKKYKITPNNFRQKAHALRDKVKSMGEEILNDLRSGKEAAK